MAKSQIKMCNNTDLSNLCYPGVSLPTYVLNWPMQMVDLNPKDMENNAAAGNEFMQRYV